MVVKVIATPSFKVTQPLTTLLAGSNRISLDRVVLVVAVDILEALGKKCYVLRRQK